MLNIQDLKSIFTPTKPGSQADIRHNICLACSEYKAKSKQCAQCFCLVPLKVRMADSVCPLRKWPEWDYTKNDN